MFSLKDYNFELLNSKDCFAFSADEKALSENEVLEALKFVFSGFETIEDRLNRWKIGKIGESMSLNGRFYFDSYQKTFAFVSAIYLLGLEQNYYPDIMFGDGFCYVTLFTIKLKGIHQNDFIMLAKIENMLSEPDLNQKQEKKENEEREEIKTKIQKKDNKNKSSKIIKKDKIKKN
jgi:pterin-4a-carbinolamine dehydratase